MIVILGASGFIGSHIYNGLKKEGISLEGTYFSNKQEGLIYFDINNMRLTDLELEGIKLEYVIISSAVNANIDGSKINWDDSYNTNVVKTKEAIDYCFQNDIIPIYLSSDNVFDGRKGSYTEVDNRNPINCYGRIKYEVENYIMACGKEFAILRMGKVFGTRLADNTLITTMMRALMSEEKVTCAIDQIFTPLYIEDLVNFIKYVIKHRLSGIFHLASLKPITRYTIALAIQRNLNLKQDNIIPCKISALGLLDERPLLIDLDISKYKKITGFEEKDIQYYLSLIQ